LAGIHEIFFSGKWAYYFFIPLRAFGFIARGVPEVFDASACGRLFFVVCLSQGPAMGWVRAPHLGKKEARGVGEIAIDFLSEEAPATAAMNGI